jgi:hypothetical protein
MGTCCTCDTCHALLQAHSGTHATSMHVQVIGRASIGHTDPYNVIAAVESELGEACVRL